MTSANNRQNVLKALLVLETTVLLLMFLTAYQRSHEESKAADNPPVSLDELLEDLRGDRELFREISPDGGYGLWIGETRPPDFPFGEAHVRVTLYEVLPEGESPRAYYRASFQAEVANDGAGAGYRVTWLEDGVQVVLHGEEQPDAYYILPFRTAGD